MIIVTINSLSIHSIVTSYSRTILNIITINNLPIIIIITNKSLEDISVTIKSLSIMIMIDRLLILYK